MDPRIVDGERWIKTRLAFLRERLAEDLSEAEREATEAEIEALSHERGLTAGGRWAGWLRRRFRRPTSRSLPPATTRWWRSNPPPPA